MTFIILVFTRCSVQAGSGPRWYSPLSQCMTAAWPSSSQTDPLWPSRGWGQETLLCITIDWVLSSHRRLCSPRASRERRLTMLMTHSASLGTSSAAGGDSADMGRCTWTPGPVWPRWVGTRGGGQGAHVCCHQVYDIYSGGGLLVLNEKGEPAGEGRPQVRRVDFWMISFYTSLIFRLTPGESSRLLLGFLVNTHRHKAINAVRWCFSYSQSLN